MSDDLLLDARAAHGRFLALVAELRPELHRYCARMVGSVAEGEDVVQDTLARAWFALGEMEQVPPLRPWLFRIAHGRAIDRLRSHERRMTRPLDPEMDDPAGRGPDPEDAIAREESTRAALSRFLELPPVPRSTVILKDVLGSSLEEIGALLDLSLPAVKSALHRGRVALQATAGRVETPVAPPPSPVVERYAALFNARDWDGVRAMLADDVRLDLVSRSKRSGRREVSAYFTNYDAIPDWQLAPGWLDGREVLAVYRRPEDEAPSYFVELGVVDGQIASILDLRYVPYIARDARFAFAAKRAWQTMRRPP